MFKQAQCWWMIQNNKFLTHPSSVAIMERGGALPAMHTRLTCRSFRLCFFTCCSRLSHTVGTPGREGVRNKMEADRMNVGCNNRYTLIRPLAGVTVGIRKRVAAVLKRQSQACKGIQLNATCLHKWHHHKHLAAPPLRSLIRS
jgi:hypothetical protein